MEPRRGRALTEAEARAAGVAVTAAIVSSGCYAALGSGPLSTASAGARDVEARSPRRIRRPRGTGLFGEKLDGDEKGGATSLPRQHRRCSRTSCFSLKSNFQCMHFFSGDFKVIGSYIILLN
jgi:hypothetical protein